MSKLKFKQRNVLAEWKMITCDLDRKHTFIKNRIKFYHINDDMIANYKNFITAYTKAKQDIENRFNDPQYDPPSDAIETAKRELVQQIENLEEFAERAELKDKQHTLIDKWKTMLIQLDRIHYRIENRLKFCDLSGELGTKHKELQSAYDQAKNDIEKRFNDGNYDPPLDALETAKKEIQHQLDREEEFAEFAVLRDSQKKLLDEWKVVVADFDRRHEAIMSKSLLMCNLLKKEHEKLSIGYVQSKQEIERRFEDPQYHPYDDAMDKAKKILTLHLEKEEAFVEHVEESIC